jgi:ribokinase
MNVPRIPNAGETILGGVFSAGPGGKGSNQAIGAARLGAQVDLLTAVGPDDYGEEGRRLWSKEGVGAQKVATGRGPTMIGLIIVEPSGENGIVVAEGALAEVSASHVEAFVPELEAAGTCLLSLEIALEAALAALAAAKAGGTRTVLNPAPAASLPPSAWGNVDYVTPNRLEAATLTGMREDAEDDELLDALRRITDAAIVMTRGDRGALVDDGRSRRDYPGKTVRRVVDTTGAGDAFSAAFATGLAEGMELEKAVSLGILAGAHAVQYREVIPSLPRRADISQT